MLDLFGTKKRKRARIEEYKAQYRKLTRTEREEFCDKLFWVGVGSVFRNRFVVESFKAAAEVEREEAQCTNLLFA